MILSIYYMHYDTDSKIVYKDRPEWFSYELCLNNIIRTIELGPTDVKIKFILMFDGNQESFNNNFCSKYFDPHESIRYVNCEYSVVFIDAGTGAKAGQITLDYICSQTFEPNNFIYTLENDYLHTDHWIENTRDICQSKIKFDYLTLYDHGDKYEHNTAFLRRYFNLKSKLYVCKKLHWRTMSSTCFSFITSPEILKHDAWIFKNFHDMKAFTILRNLKRRILLSAIPGQSTHCMSDYLSPAIDWDDIANRTGTI
jgi:hypothetical protein